MLLIMTDDVGFAATAGASSKRTTQYFEMLGNRAIYHDGWAASTTPVTVPWHMTPTVPDVITGYKWELYDVRSDPRCSRRSRYCRWYWRAGPGLMPESCARTTAG